MRMHLLHLLLGTLTYTGPGFMEDYKFSASFHGGVIQIDLDSGLLSKVEI